VGSRKPDAPRGRKQPGPEEEEDAGDGVRVLRIEEEQERLENAIEPGHGGAP
jgi:hypothetical protein